MESDDAMDVQSVQFFNRNAIPIIFVLDTEFAFDIFEGLDEGLGVKGSVAREARKLPRLPVHFRVHRLQHFVNRRIIFSTH